MLDLSVNDALLLIGHGSGRYPDAADPMRRHAETLRSRGWSVEIAVLNGSPTVAEALGRIGAATVRVVPFFMEDGYFSRVAVPRALEAVLAGAGARSTPSPGAAIQFAPPVGLHDGIAAIIERQGLAACAALGVAPDTAAVVVIGHGSAIAPGRALALHRHCSRVAATATFTTVQAACLEEAPFVADVLGRLSLHPVVVVGFFANQAGHVLDDIPALLAAEQSARGSAGLPVRFHASVTDDPAMADIILEQAAVG
ncbi:MAG TPA: hypothetical protein DDZ81_09085 [Acetobacteraceae bacterium]|nr:hypothetical protein [Acetobacteraceae bacterium]